MDKNGEDQFLFSGELLHKIFNSLSAHIAIIDETGVILETNLAWKNFSKTNGLSGTVNFNQMNYLGVCEAASRDGIKDAQAVASGIRQVINRKIGEFLYDYPCPSPTGPRWFYMRAVLMAEGSPLRVIISHEDITQLKLAQEALKENQRRLEDKNQSLNESNTALKVLIQQRENDKAEMEKRFLANVKTLIQPYISKLKQVMLSEKDRTLVSILDDHLNDIISPLMQNLNNAGIMLTPQEIQVASLVKDGKTTSEIADVLFVSEATISFHRKNLREKLGLKSRRANLRAFLLSVS
ncbi:MAG: helix-turn-helix transcriptional regulator [Desulfobacula sp.]|jgi:DNA-binding CsgD family transcriptional regulator|uniref:LuxR C-terminal-related transcriptional regulator n=1 Tax=Desulfobacula sp. TaxID=2593537 RepID=UPI001DE5D82D|nr:helix-turn-helix transcriptional regulator [Desulfobacula sp.]MBT3803608.1 helix-turn-helix transcriptional regulator [Desulfobacula sp.]MBT4024183.1 helix-turn-helix transcriptional regulator [Desulfobacula sp.]MBT4199341.1 helix-turn-helix transcriptional regulator [Desulfobacula sp.]MBT4507084.1 helix-turn-helix transcriptional regulator [Desulfobacula sp.]